MSSEYSMLIQWSDEDQVYVVSLPEFGPYAQTHGSTYVQAAKQGREALESLVETYIAESRSLPKPCKYGTWPVDAHTVRRKKSERTAGVSKRTK